MSLFSVKFAIFIILFNTMAVKQIKSRGIVRGAPCIDKLTICGFLTNSCTDVPAWAKENCPSTCDLCDKCVSSENNIYNKGDKWCHGNEICTCIDGSLSHESYTCQRFGCPVFKGVPYECPLIWDTNTCCPIPDPNHKRCVNAEVVGTQLIG